MLIVFKSLVFERTETHLEPLRPFQRAFKFIVYQVNFHVRPLTNINARIVTAQTKRASVYFCRSIAQVVRQGQVRLVTRVARSFGQEEVDEFEFDSTTRNAVNNPLALELLTDNGRIKGTLQNHRVSWGRFQSSFSWLLA